MRTTLTLDDDLAMELQSKARDEGRSFKDVVNEALRRGLEVAVPASAAPITVRVFAGGFVPGVDLVKANQLAAQLEDDHTIAVMREATEAYVRKHGTES